MGSSQAAVCASMSRTRSESGHHRPRTNDSGRAAASRCRFLRGTQAGTILTNVSYVTLGRRVRRFEMRSWGDPA